MQYGAIVEHHGSWVLRYYDTVLHEGKPVRKKIFKRLAKIGPDYPNRRSVLLLAEKYLAPINAGTAVPESSMKLSAFIEDILLPWAEKNLRASTVKHYKKDLQAAPREQLAMLESTHRDG
jgi:hypothetical protein